jgi:hypothetical protein
VDEAVSEFSNLLKDAKARHGAGKRARVFQRMDGDGSPPPG